MSESSTTPRTGVADYFGIIGVGDKLIYKHRQKQYQEVAEELPTQDDDEDDAEEEQQRFDREIVDVSIWVEDRTVSEASSPEENTVKEPQQRDGWTVVQHTLPSATPVYAPVEDDGQSLLLWNKGTVWDANLDWNDGLGATVLSKQEVTNKKSLRKKVESTWKQFQPFRAKPHSTTRRFSLAFIRRRDARAAVADLELCYVRLHTTILQQTQTAPNSPLPGLAGQFLKGYKSQAKHPQREDVSLVNLRDFLTLPDGFDEWSIPTDYQWIRDPQQAMGSPRRKTTVVCDQEGVTTPTSSTMGVEAFDTDDIDPQALIPKQVDHNDMFLHVDMQFCYIPILAIRRQRISDEERYHEDPGVVDLAVTFIDRSGQPVLPQEDDDEEEEEEGTFRLLGKSKWEIGTASPKESQRQELSSARKPPFAALKLLVRRNLPYGFCDTPFATRVLGRFPFHNYKGLPLPEEELPMFCYPTGCRLYRARLSEAPVAQYYGFVVKNERGDSIYVSCVSFMEPLTPEKANQLAMMSEKRAKTSLAHKRFCEQNKPHNDIAVSAEDGSNLLLTSFDEMITFENKTICLVSRFPFWTAFRKFLLHMHVLSGSLSDLPLERYISHLLLSVPLPKEGGSHVIIPLPALSEPMVLWLAPEKDFPLVDLPYQRLFACLEVKTVVMIVLSLLALERKLIVMSTRPSLVLDVCELLRSLLFPFDLCAPYVPRLTEPFKSSLEFPGAIFVGIHDDGLENGLAATVKATCPEDGIIVDLDTGDVDCDGDRLNLLSKAWEIIPEGPRSMLVSELETLCRDASIVDGQEPLDSQYDAAFDVALSSAVQDVGISNHKAKEPFDDRAARDAFLRFFCAVLGGYERFLVVPDADFLVSGNEWFDGKGYLASVKSDCAPYLNALVSTQLFQSFIQRRTEASDVHCLLFDESLVEFHSSSVPYGRLGGDVDNGSTTDGEEPVLRYSLLVDQSATPAQNADSSTIISHNRSFDTASEGDSGPNISRLSVSVTETMESQFAETVLNLQGDLITRPTNEGLPDGKKYMYCVNGNPCFPHSFNEDYFLPKKPDSLLVEMSKSTSPLLARSERELEEANRRRRLATSYRGFQAQRRCLWQLPKLMGSHFLGAWLLCIPWQVSQPQLSHEQQSRFLQRALGALRLLRSKQRIVPDEAAYRALMVACGRSKSDRRVELVKLFGLLRSDGIFPSAVTLGQYTRALAEGYSKSATGSGKEDDIAGPEGAETGSTIGRYSVVSQSQRFVTDFEACLNAMDPFLASLEEQGRRWRQKGSHQNNDEADKKKRNTSRSWLPVSLSPSFVPGSSRKEGKEPIRFFALWSRTTCCKNCNYIPLEEEVNAGWDIVGGEHEVPGSIACPRCGSLILPKLGYREMSVSEALNSDKPPSSASGPFDFAELPPQISPSIDISEEESDRVAYVAYINPITLRLSLEQYVEEYGEEVLQRERLQELDPEVFYNFWWYCARFNLPFPLTTESSDTNYCAVVAWDKMVAERGCWSAAKVLGSLMGDCNTEDDDDFGTTDAVEDDRLHLLSRFNLQGYYSTVWDHHDLSKVLVSLVEACDKRDFRPVLDSVIKGNHRRHELFDPDDGSAVASDVNVAVATVSEGSTHVSAAAELDVYRTVLYLAKYQCTTAFHTFFPASSRACKGYHYWCAIGTPVPMFDRLIRDGAQRLNQNNNKTVAAPLHLPSEVALGFRCVFGHLI